MKTPGRSRRFIYDARKDKFIEVKATGKIKKGLRLELTLTELGYIIKPNSSDALSKLPSLTKGGRIAAIREARGKTKAQLQREAGIPSSTYVYIERRDALPYPHQLFAISRALEVDPLIIITGHDEWEKAASGLHACEKIALLRLRRGWIQEDFAEALEKAGLKFDSDCPRATVAQWERGVMPSADKRPIIEKVLGQGDIFVADGKAARAHQPEGKHNSFTKEPGQDLSRPAEPKRQLKPEKPAPQKPKKEEEKPFDEAPWRVSSLGVKKVIVAGAAGKLKVLAKGKRDWSQEAAKAVVCLEGLASEGILSQEKLVDIYDAFIAANKIRPISPKV